MLKRLFENDENLSLDSQVFTKKKQKSSSSLLSLSRSRSGSVSASHHSPSSQSSTQTQLVKTEPWQKNTQPQAELSMECKKEDPCDVSKTHASCLEQLSKVIHRTEIKQASPDNLCLDIPTQQEPLDSQHAAYGTGKYTSEKKSLLLHTSLTEDKFDTHPKKETPDTACSETYHCFICHEDLSHMKHTFFRQRHVEKCLSHLHEETNDTKASTSDERVLEWSVCFFCQQNLSHYKAPQRLVHLNRCLDEQTAIVDVAKTNEDALAGQTHAFLQTLKICPVCHEMRLLQNKTVQQKLMHIKQCAKQHNIEASHLVRRCQWIRWGHGPTLPDPIPPPPPEQQPSTMTKAMPQHQLKASLPPQWSNDPYDATDLDFDDTVILHKQACFTSQASKAMDKEDEELQTALAMSRSLHQMQNTRRPPKKRQGIRPTDEREWNSTNIWSIEESRKRAIETLDQLLFAPDQHLQALHQAEREKSHLLLGASRIVCEASSNENTSAFGTFYWNLASNRDNNWDAMPSVFTSLFMQKIN
ncbi:hypothetical protein BDF20DRAFT_901519 [Mycotypha africana]|uniref:uncharacterized protein n=1 Tax=Mycotypha africana TaxID=64632 RepID=UPI0023010E99|nr:uncharacterized protein BDF20DRAFT_901519 [Mycotypha africana]KAI8967264.1 hypothetical protein BDF20DRAFT_901519 [Mycotypha africana]